MPVPKHVKTMGKYVLYGWLSNRILRVHNGGGCETDKQHQPYSIRHTLDDQAPIGPCMQRSIVRYHIGSGRLTAARNDIVAGA